MRVYELAKELGTNSKHLIEISKGTDFVLKSHLESLTNEEIENVKAIFEFSGENEEKEMENLDFIQKQNEIDPDREQQLKDLRERVQNSEYKIDSEKVAEKIIEKEKKKGFFSFLFGIFK